MSSVTGDVVQVLLYLQHDDKAIQAVLLFDAQPTAEDVLHAFSTPSLSGREDYPAFRTILTQCLETYGVPQLDRIKLKNPDLKDMDVTMVQAQWAINVMDSNVPTPNAASELPVGRICISRRAINAATRVAPPAPPIPAQAKGKPKAKRTQKGKSDEHF